MIIKPITDPDQPIGNVDGADENRVYVVQETGAQANVRREIEHCDQAKEEANPQPNHS
jgi:hypothetical protein